VPVVSATDFGSDLAGKAAGGRKLIAVVYADMVGYSRLIGLDDAGTLRRLRTLRRALIDPAIREHGGRVAQTGGDSLLVAFDSIDGAVRCAVKVQQQMPVYDGDQPPDRRIRFRIGINIGDVIPHGTDLHGEGVNVAARLEAASPVGGICVSRTVPDHVHGRLGLSFEPVGELTLKNIARPVEAFVLRLDPGAADKQSGDDTSGAIQARQPGARTRYRPALAAGVAVLFVSAVATAGWWFARAPAGDSKGPETMPIATASQPARPAVMQAAVTPDVGLSNAPRLSLVVLPFDKMGGEGVEDYIVDGIAEDLTTDLSRLPGFLVIARNSAFTYKGKPIDIKRVGEELGVRYAVEGSVRKAGGAQRINVQLVSTETGAHIWAERFDVGRDDVGNSLDDIVRQIAWQLNGQIVNTESARGARERPANPDATDILLRARALDRLPRNPQRQAEIVALFERAVELDPMSATALARLGQALLNSFGLNAADDPNGPGRLHRAEELIAQAELMRPDEMAAMLARVDLLNYQDRCEEVIPAAQRTIGAYPNVPGPHFALGLCLLRNGRSADAIPKIEQAIRLDPRHPSRGHWLVSQVPRG
jgi:adenylate cyclase